MLYTLAMVFSSTDKATLETLNKPIAYYFKSYIIHVRHGGQGLASVAGGIAPTNALFQRGTFNESGEAARRTLVRIPSRPRP